MYVARGWLLHACDGLRGRPGLWMFALACGDHLGGVLFLVIPSPPILVDLKPQFALVPVEGIGDSSVPPALRHALEFTLQALDLFQDLLAPGASRLRPLMLVL